MSSIYNFLESPIRRNVRQVPLLERCLCIFSLKNGCRLIALFEAIISAMQIYLIRQDIGELPKTSTNSQETKGSYTNEQLFVDNPFFANALDTFVLLNSLLLLAGTELDNIRCLILWICITIFSKTIDIILHMMQGYDLDSMFFLCTSLIIKIYFCGVVASLIWKLQDKLRASVSETEVLYTQSEEV